VCCEGFWFGLRLVRRVYFSPKRADFFCGSDAHQNKNGP
jgi:hypothetical protein